jgi:peptidoglycan hydrolase CwlO-like protein
MEPMYQENKIMKVLYNQVALVLAICGVAFGIYFKVTEPTAHTEAITQANNVAIQLMEQRIVAQRTTIDELTKTQQNDMKELKNEMAGERSEIQALTNHIVKLQTIIEERIPVKK